MYRTYKVYFWLIMRTYSFRDGAKSVVLHRVGDNFNIVAFCRSEKCKTSSGFFKGKAYWIKLFFFLLKMFKSAWWWLVRTARHLSPCCILPIIWAHAACCWAIWLRYHAASLSSDSKQVKDAPLDSKEIVLVKLKPKMAGDTCGWLHGLRNLFLLKILNR